MRWPSTIFSPVSCMPGRKMKCASVRGRSIVQPVNARATSVTSFCV
jgi:hypothetical protein